MSGLDTLMATEDRLVTGVGAWFPGDRVVFRGQDLHRDLRDIDWLDLYFFGATGRRYTREQLKFFGTAWVYTSFPDPRLWNNRVAALAGSVRSTGNLALSAAIAVSEASVYGRGADLQAYNLIKRIAAGIDAGETLDSLVPSELKHRRCLPGFGRPVTRRDERIEHFLSISRRGGFDQGRHLALAMEMDNYLKTHRWRLGLNYAGLIAALAADLDFSPRDFYLCTMLVFVAGIVPCYRDALEKPEGSFFPLRCTRIAYEGCTRRSWGED